MSSSAPPPSSQTESEKKLQSEIDDLQEQLKLKTNECDFLEAEQKKTKGQLTASEETAGKLKSELEAAHAAVGDACDLLTPEQHETRTAQLRSNVSELEVLVKERNAELGRMGEKCSAAEKERDDLKARVTSLTRDVEDASKSEKDLQAQVDLLTSKLEQERGMSAGFKERAVSAELDLQTAKSRVQRRPSTPTSATPSSAGLGPPSSAATSTQRTSHESSTTGVELRKSQLAYYKGQLDSVPRASESLTPEKLGDIKLNEYYYAPSTRRSLNIGDTPSNEKNTKDVKKRLVMTQWDAIPNDAANSMYARCKALIQATCDVSAGYKANLVEVGILVDYLSHTDPSWRRSDQLYQAYAMFEIAFTNLNRPKDEPSDVSSTDHTDASGSRSRAPTDNRTRATPLKPKTGGAASSTSSHSRDPARHTRQNPTRDINLSIEEDEEEQEDRQRGESSRPQMGSQVAQGSQQPARVSFTRMEEDSSSSVRSAPPAFDGEITADMRSGFKTGNPSPSKNKKTKTKTKKSTTPPLARAKSRSSELSQPPSSPELDAEIALAEEALAQSVADDEASASNQTLEKRSSASPRRSPSKKPKPTPATQQDMTEAEKAAAKKARKEERTRLKKEEAKRLKRADLIAAAAAAAEKGT